MRIRTKIFTLVGALSLATLAVAGIGVSSVQTVTRGLQDSNAAAQRAFNSERLNRLVTAVVMDSRGIYAAADVKAATPFAKAIGTELAQIDALFAAWRPLVPDSELALFEGVSSDARTFKTFRTEIARAGVEASPAAANALGNNDANRASRKAFQAKIDELTKVSNDEVAAVRAEADRQASQGLVLLLGSALAAILAALGIGGLIAHRQIARPLQRVTHAIQSLAAGDYRLQAPKDTRDEIGDIWRSMTVFAGAMSDAARLRAEQAEAETLVAAERKTAMMQLADSFEAAVGGIVNSVSSSATQLQASAQVMSGAMERTTSQSVAVAAASEEASASVQTVASAAEELSSSVQEIGRQVSESSRIARQAVSDTTATADNIRDLAEASQRIGKVVDLISTVAGQTNLLALNATIEAARAGDAGKGFAVVAAEVKQLADQTAKATSEIAAQIDAIQSSTQLSMAAVQGIGKTIESMDRISSGIESSIDQQGATTQEIALSIQQVSQGTAEVAHSISGVTQAATDSSAVASQVFASSSDLAAQALRLKTEMQRFLETVRAA